MDIWQHFMGIDWMGGTHAFMVPPDVTANALVFTGGLQLGDIILLTMSFFLFLSLFNTGSRISDK